MGSYTEVKPKLAVVSPILKDGNHKEPHNNRPISLLPILSKVWERVALNQIMPYLMLNERLSTRQSGNKKLHSTETSLIRITDAILNSIDEKKTTEFVLLDMSKAFDTINHGILEERQWRRMQLCEPCCVPKKTFLKLIEHERKRTREEK